MCFARCVFVFERALALRVVCSCLNVRVLCALRPLVRVLCALRLFVFGRACARLSWRSRIFNRVSLVCVLGALRVLVFERACALRVVCVFALY